IALELARNKHFIDRVDDYEKLATKKLIDNEIWLHGEKVRIGLKNIPKEEIDRIRAYKKASLVLKMDDLKKVFGDDIEDPKAISDTNKIDSAEVIAKLAAMDAPTLKGKGQMQKWMIERLKLDNDTASSRAQSVYTKYRNVHGVEDIVMVKSV